MADTYPNQTARGTEVTEVVVAAQDLQAQDLLVSINGDALYGNRTVRFGSPSAGSALGVGRISEASIASRVAFSSVGSTASVASAPTVASTPSLASAGSAVSAASAASVDANEFITVTLELTYPVAFNI